MEGPPKKTIFLSAGSKSTGLALRRLELRSRVGRGARRLLKRGLEALELALHGVVLALERAAALKRGILRRGALRRLGRALLQLLLEVAQN